MKIQLIRYSVMAAPLAFLGLPLYVYIPTVYAELPLISLSLVGLVLMGARLFDLVTDPLLGFVMDRWRQFIRPRTMMLAGTPLVMIGIYQLFNPDASTRVSHLAVYLLISYLGLTLVMIPYYSWGAEISQRLGQHQQLAVWREGGAIVGTLLALFIAASIGEFGALQSMAVAVLILLPFGLLLIYGLPDGNDRAHHDSAQPFVLWKTASRATRHVLTVHFINTLASSMPATLFLLYVAHVLDLTQQQSGLLLLVYFVSAILALPLWVCISRLTGELNTWRYAILLAAVAFVPAGFLGAGDFYPFMLVCIATGATLGADIAVPASIQSQLASRASHQSGYPREASSFGLWGMVSKLALALGVGITMPMLDLFPEGEPREYALSWMYALLPIVVKIIAAFWLRSVSAHIEHELNAHSTTVNVNYSVRRDVNEKHVTCMHHQRVAADRL